MPKLPPRLQQLMDAYLKNPKMPRPSGTPYFDRNGNKKLRDVRENMPTNRKLYV